MQCTTRCQRALRPLITGWRGRGLRRACMSARAAGDAAEQLMQRAAKQLRLGVPGRHLMLCCDAEVPKCCRLDDASASWAYLKKRLKVRPVLSFGGGGDGGTMWQAAACQQAPRRCAGAGGADGGARADARVAQQGPLPARLRQGTHRRRLPRPGAALPCATARTSE